jgi:L-2,4-diaminobutyrate transaminase
MSEMRINDPSVLDRAHVFHPSTHMGQHARGETPNRIVTGGKGVYIVDRDGSRSLDAFAGLYCVNVGYGRTEIADAIHEQAKKLAYYHLCRPLERGDHPPVRAHREDGGDGHEPGLLRAVGLGRQRDQHQAGLVLQQRARPPGEEEDHLALARLSRLRTDDRQPHRPAAVHNAFDLPLDRVLHTTCPHYWREGRDGESERDFSMRCAAELDALIEAEGPETVAAFIGEPVMGTGGIITPPEGYWEEIQKVLKKHDVLLDRRRGGHRFGRTGELFGSHTYGIRPDLITIAKGVSSAICRCPA